MHPNRSDSAAQGLSSVRDIARTLVRYGWMVLVPMVAAGFVMSRRAVSTDDATARMRLGLTQEIVWPFYDAARDRIQSMIHDPATLEAVRARLGASADIVSVSAEVPQQQAFVDVIVRSRTAAGATAGVEALSSYVIEQNEARHQADLITRKDAAQRQMDEIQAEIDQANTELETIDTRLGELQPETAIPIPQSVVMDEWRKTLDRRDELSQRRGIDISRTAVVQQELDLVSRKLGVSAPEVEVVQTPIVASQESKRSDLGLSLLAAGLAGLFGACVALVYDTRWARLRSARHIRNGAGRDLIAIEPDRSLAEPARSAVYVSQLVGQSAPGEVLGVATIAGARTGQVVAAIAALSDANGVPAITIGPDLDLPAGIRRVGVDLRTAQDQEATAAAIDSVLDTVRSGHAVHVVIDSADWLAAGHALRALLPALREQVAPVVVHCGATSGVHAAAWAVLAPSCDSIALFVDRRDRQGALRNALDRASAAGLRVRVAAFGDPIAGGAGRSERGGRTPERSGLAPVEASR